MNFSNWVRNVVDDDVVTNYWYEDNCVVYMFRTNSVWNEYSVRNGELTERNGRECVMFERQRNIDVLLKMRIFKWIRTRTIMMITYIWVANGILDFLYFPYIFFPLFFYLIITFFQETILCPFHSFPPSSSIIQTAEEMLINVYIYVCNVWIK